MSRQKQRISSTVQFLAITVHRGDGDGDNVVENPVHVHDLQPTILHLLGLDYKRLTSHYQGRDFRLTDVHGHLV